jgi:hypothetical protein
MEWAKLIGGWIFSWPAAAVIVALTLRSQIAQWLQTITDLRAGPVRITRQLEAVAKAGESTLDLVSQMIVLLGESRMTEVRVTLKTVGAVFDEDDKKKMFEQIAAIEGLLNKIEGTRGRGRKPVSGS